MLQGQLLRAGLIASFLAMLVGCGSSPLATTQAPLTASKAVSAKTVDLGVAQQAGSIVIAAAKLKSTQATTSDVRAIKVTLSGSVLSSPLAQTVNWPLAQDLVFSNLDAGTYSVKVEALDSAASSVGAVSQDGVTVQAGQVTLVPLRLTLNSAAPSQGGLSLGIIIEDGTQSVSPSPSPTPIFYPEPIASSSVWPTPIPLMTTVNKTMSGLWIFKTLKSVTVLLENPTNQWAHGTLMVTFTKKGQQTENVNQYFSLNGFQSTTIEVTPTLSADDAVVFAITEPSQVEPW